MTGPVGPNSFGAAYIDFHASTTNVEKDVKRSMDKLAKDSDKITEKAGTSLGRSLGDNVADEVARPEFGRKVGRAASRSVSGGKIKIPVEADVDRRRVATLGEKAATSFLDGFSKLLKGPANFVTSIGSSIGNVGKGPLGLIIGSAIIIGLPAIVAAIASLIAVFYPLVNVLLLVPGALAVIGTALIPLITPFMGLGEAIGAVMEGATTLEGLKRIDAILKPLGKTVAAVVVDFASLFKIFKSFFPTLRTDFFRSWVVDLDKGLTIIDKIKDALTKPIKSQISFGENQEFIPTGDKGGTTKPGFSSIIEGATQINPFLAGLRELFSKAGVFVRDFLLLVTHPSVNKFLVSLLSTTGNVFEAIGPGFNRFIVGLADLGLVSLPRVESGAASIGGILQTFGEWLTKISENGQFNGLMDRLDRAWEDLKTLAASGWNLITAIIGSTEEQGGARSFFDALISVIDSLTEFFESDTGRKAMQGFIVAAKVILWLLGLIVKAWFLIGVAIKYIEYPISRMINGLKSVWRWLENIWNKTNDIRNLLGMLPAVAILSKLASYAGYAEGGIVASPTLSMLGEGSKPEVVIPLTNKARALELAQASGLAAMLQKDSNGGGTSIIFGASSIQIMFSGAVPSQEEAYRTGAAVATGISDQLAKRNVRLAVRTL